jgi:tRNA-modifying protein YgfZ
MTVHAALLAGRSFIEVSGGDRVSFIQGLITNGVEELAKGAACFAGLLSPQGKVLFDFFAIDTGEAIVLDCAAPAAPELLKRLGFYKLRAKVQLSDVSARWLAGAAWGDGAAHFLKQNSDLVFQDPRLPALGCRALIGGGKVVDWSQRFDDYEAMRIAAAVPEAGKDYAYGAAFPHEVCFDLLHGVDFKKGCYVGQEVVSRMQHRGTARTRVLAASSEHPLPEGGVDILADGFAVGRLGSVSGTAGIALARLDRAGEAQAKGQALMTAGGVPLTLSVPRWATYTLENEAAGAVR